MLLLVYNKKQVDAVAYFVATALPRLPCVLCAMYLVLTFSEEREWRLWADKVLVHTLSPNVYRTMFEALETFKWFEEAGGWRNSFPAWECALMVYGGAAAMWIIAKRLKARQVLRFKLKRDS